MTVPTSVRLGISQGHGGATVVAGARTFANALAARINRPVKVHVADDYATLQKTLVGGGVDLGWMPPFLAVEAIEAGASLLAVCERNGALTYRSALVVRSDSPIRSLDALVGARAAWVDRQSASGYVFPRLHLVASGIDLARAFASETFYGSPRAACSAVADEEADLCACFTSEAHAGSFEHSLADVARVYPAASWRLRVLRVTDSIPSDGLVAAPQVDAELRARLVEGMSVLHERPDGAQAVSTLLFADKLVKVDANVERLIARLRTMLPMMR